MAKSVKKNFAYQIVYELLVITLPFVTSPYIARVIGAEGLGIFSFHQSIAYYFVLFSMLGLKNHGNRAIAGCRDNPQIRNQTFSDLLLIHIIVSMGCCIIYVIYSLSRSDEKLYSMIQIAYVLSALFDISWFFFGIEEFKLTVMRNIIIKILTVLSVFIFVKEKDDLSIYCIIMALGHLISQLTLWIPLHKYVHFVKPKWISMKVHFIPLLVLFIPSIAVSLYKYMDKIMIGYFADKTQLGYYENAEKVVNIPVTIIAAFGTVMLPKMSNLAVQAKKDNLKYYMEISMKYVMCMALVLSAGLSGAALVFATVFWGADFSPSGGIIMCLATTVPFIAFANIIRTQFLIPNKRDKDFIISVVAGAVINLILNLILIKPLGAYGATIGTIVAEMLVCLIQTFSVRKQLPIRTYLKSFAFFIPIALCAFGLVYHIGAFMGESVLTLVVQIAAGGAFYCSIAAVYLYLTKDKFFVSTLERFFHMKRSN